MKKCWHAIKPPQRLNESEKGIRTGAVRRLAASESGWVAEYDDAAVMAKTVLLAKGVINRHPDMTAQVHDEAVRTGRLRYCPICDGYEVTDQRVAVIGTGDHGAREADFCGRSPPT